MANMVSIDEPPDEVHLSITPLIPTNNMKTPTKVKMLTIFMVYLPPHMAREKPLLTPGLGILDSVLVPF